MSTGIVIQARSGSTRLPNKILKPFFEEDSILSLLISNIKADCSDHIIVLATTTSTIDDKVADLGKQLGVEVFRGSENDVLDRFVQVADQYQLDTIIRVCADNPLLDTSSIKEMLTGYKGEDYYAFGLSNGTPTIKTHYGFWPEVVSSKALRKASSMTDEAFYHEHVTNFIYGHPESFSVTLKNIDAKLEEQNKLRFTIDTIEDFDLVQSVYEDFVKQKMDPTPLNLYAYAEQNEELLGRMESEISRWEK